MPGFAKCLPCVASFNSHYNSHNDGGNIIIPKISVGEKEGLRLNFSSMMPKSVFLITEKRCAGAQT